MQTYLRIGQTYLFAQIQITDNQLFIHSHQGIRQAIERKIDLSRIDCLYKAPFFGSEQIYFSYEGEHYWIYEAGLVVQDYLKNHLVN